jgi:hypothetical protein
MHLWTRRTGLAFAALAIPLLLDTCGKSGTEPKVPPPPAGYTIKIQYYGPAPSAAIQTAMNAAVAKWQQIITDSLSTVNLNVGQGLSCLGVTNTPAVNQATNGLVMLATFDSIDGPGNILGQAGPCQIRNSNSLTVIGLMEFDTADVATMIAKGSLNSVMLHEMGHVLGFGTLWDQAPNACLQLPSDSVIKDTYFSCAKARAAFDSIGGTAYTGASLSPPGGNKVPVENCGASSPAGCGEGTRNGHWREPVFGSELMTGYINSGINPLSVVTVAAMADLGYKVNYAAADAFVRTFTAPAAGGAAPLVLGDDIRRGLITKVDAVGRVVGVVER